MMDVIPVLIDGAVVLNLYNDCSSNATPCENCTGLVLNIHNWIKVTGIDYVIFDFQDEKDVCPSFIEEILFLRKRLKVPFLFVGVMVKPMSYIENYTGEQSLSFSMFMTPEDAVRAIRIYQPGLTEGRLNIPVRFGIPLLDHWRQFQLEQFS